MPISISAIVVDTSPLILLAKSGQIELLPRLFETIVAPQGVLEEIAARQPPDAAATIVGCLSWLGSVSVDILPEILAWDLGRGESEVLTYSLENPTYRAVLDDAAARKCAKTFQIASIGTGGILVLAKRKGAIASVTDRLNRLKDSGLWISSEVEALLRHQAGE